MQPRPLERAGASPSLIARSSHLCPAVWGFWWEHHRKGNVFPIKGFQWRRKRENARDTDQAERGRQTDGERPGCSLPYSLGRTMVRWSFGWFFFPLPLTGSVPPQIKSAPSGNTGIINKAQGYSPVINIKHITSYGVPPTISFLLFFPLH